MSHIETQWIVAEAPDVPPDIDPSLPQILVRMMLQRGVAPDDMASFLRPRLADLSDPFLLPDMQQAVDRILSAIDNNESICVYGDYDVDGITSVTILCNLLESYGVQARPFIPRRGPEGYGLNDAAMERCMAEGKPNLLITVDCGTASTEEVATLSSEGVDVIVVDHHEPPPQGIPNCTAVVNPKRNGKFDYLCAAGVVFKLAHALLKARRIPNYDLKNTLDLVALATVADIVPLQDENRLLVRHGLRQMRHTAHPGLRALIDVSQVKSPIAASDIGFRIGPRINAAGRMDKPEDALHTLTSSSAQQANKLATVLETHNRNRQAEELRINKEAMQMVEDSGQLDSPVIVLGSRDWHPGVVGIVASRLMRRFHKPTFIIAIDQDGLGKGSGRSIGGVSLMDAINANRECLVAGGGHAMAAGISVQEDQIQTFREGFASYVTDNVRESDRKPRLHIDAEIDFPELSLKFLDSYELLQPFGSSNPEPIFISKNVYLAEPPRELKNNHLKLSLKQNECWQSAMFFGGGLRELPPHPWDVAFTINRNTFRGNTSLQMVIQDIRSHQE